MRNFSILVIATAALLISRAFGMEVLEPRLMEAVRIYTLYRTTELFSATCKKWERHTSSAVESAVAKLLEKHSAKIANANSVLNEQFWQEQRRQLDESMAADGARLDQRFREAPEELRRDWCEKFPERIERADRALSENPQYKKHPDSEPYRPPG